MTHANFEINWTQGVEDSNKRRTPFRSEMPQLLSYQHSILTTLKVDVH